MVESNEEIANNLFETFNNTLSQIFELYKTSLSTGKKEIKRKLLDGRVLI